MNYNIEYVISQLQDEQKKGKELISRDELIKLINMPLPQINNIDAQIKMIDIGIKKQPHAHYDYYGYDSGYITFSSAEYLTGIPRQTFCRWADKGILKTYTVMTSRRFILSELKNVLLFYKKLYMSRSNTQQHAKAGKSGHQEAKM
jgi:hypothetical protein